MRVVEEQSGSLLVKNAWPGSQPLSPSGEKLSFVIVFLASSRQVNLFFALKNERTVSLEPVILDFANLEDAKLHSSHLENAALNRTQLKGASFFDAHLEETSFLYADLSNTQLEFAHLEGTCFIGANLSGAEISRAYLSRETRLDDTILSSKPFGAVSLVDVYWGDCNVGVIDWAPVSILGNEHRARQPLNRDKKRRAKHEQLEDYREAVRAYRQLAVLLHNQGLSDDANRFAYRAQIMQCKVYWHQKKLPQWLFSWFLALLAGYGYKPWRSFLAYLIVIAAFATAYFIVGQRVGPALSPLGAWVFSMTSFHGRGFFPGGIKLDDPLTVLAAFEAFIGLLIEVTFIATLTRRLFGQ